MPEKLNNFINLFVIIVVVPAILTLWQLELTSQNEPFQKALDVTLEGTTLSTLPLELREGINELLKQQLQLDSDNTDLIGQLTKYKKVNFALDNDFSLATTGDPAGFLAQVTSWLTEQDQIKRPVQRQFTLPDGSKGTEIIPGDPQAIFSPVDEDNCYGPAEEKHSFWVCLNKSAASISASREASKQGALKVQSSKPQIAFNTDKLKMLTDQEICQGVWCQFSSLEANLQEYPIQVTIW